MKVLIFSDSHGRMENIRDVLIRSGKVDMVIHLGDIERQEDTLENMCECPVIIVRGNCDFASDKDVLRTMTLGNHKAFITHGHHYSVKYGLERIYFAAREQECDIVMFGHTHVPMIQYDEGITYINPGSIEIPVAGCKPSYMLMEIDSEGEAHFTLNYL